MVVWDLVVVRGEGSVGVERRISSERVVVGGEIAGGEGPVGGEVRFRDELLTSSKKPVGAAGALDADKVCSQ